MRSKFLLLAVIALSFLSIGNAIVVINSVDSRDVISGAAYANVIGENVVFVPQKADLTIFISKVKNGGPVTLLQSNNPVYINLEDILSTNSITVARKVELGSAEDNEITLAQMASPKGYVIVTSEYGYPSISALPYAKANGYFLLLGFQANAQRIAETTEGKPVVVIGYVSSDILNALDDAGTGYYRIDTGDKYLDNIATVRGYLAKTDTNTFLLTDGNILEESLINANSPVLFISTIVPEATQSFVKERASKGQAILNLIGSEYVQPLYNMKKSIDAELGNGSCIARLKIGEAVPYSSNTPQEPDTIVLPGPYSEAFIDSSTYNTNTGTLDITMGNTGNAPAYISMGIKAFVGGTVIGVLPATRDFVNPGEIKGYSFNLTVPEGSEGAMTAEMTVFHGVSNLSLDTAFTETRNVSHVTFIDRSSALVENAKYGKGSKDLSFLLKNNGTVKAYYKAAVYALESGGSPITFRDDRVYELEPGEAKAVMLSMLPFGEDVSSITLNVDYGAREGFLSKTASFNVQMEEDNALIFAAIAAIIIIVLAALLLRKKK
jgi:hypothetical protein